MSRYPSQLKAKDRTLLRVGFTSIDERLWTGGYQYLANLFQAIHQFEPGRLQPVLFHGSDLAVESRAMFQSHGVECICDPVFSFDQRTSAIELIKTVIVGINRPAVAAFERQRIDVVFECARFFGRRMDIPAMAWIPDMQHRRMPEMFGSSGFWRRDIGFRMQISANRTIVLSSEEARGDCEQHYPQSRGRTRVVRFARMFSETEVSADPEMTREKYGLPPGFVYLPNQFWKHKNHQIVIEALGHLRRSGRSVVVAATGVLQDLRHSRHAQEIVRMIREEDVEQEFRVLGRIPYMDVIALMRAASAVLNPSLCEGWSTTVEEAKALGVPMILSAIGVHLEQARDKAVFFDPGSASDLAARLLSLSPLSESERGERERAASREARTRSMSFAGQFCEVAEKAASRE